VADLPGLAERVAVEPDRYTVVPITPQRARAHAANPVADGDDVGLLVAFLDDRCVGYLGLLPVALSVDGERRKVLSLSTFYVDPAARRSGAGGLLLMRAVGLELDVFVAGFSEESGKVYAALGFTASEPLTFLTLRLDALLPVSFLLAKVSRTLRLRGLTAPARLAAAGRRLAVATLDRALRPFTLALVGRAARRQSSRVVAEPISHVSPELAGRATETGVRLVRDAEVINWMIDAPWITDEPGPELAYEFSYRRPLFRHLAFELRERSERSEQAEQAENGECGYVVLLVSRNEDGTVIKILDQRAATPGLRAAAVRTALEEAGRFSADVIECGIEHEAQFARSAPFRAVILRKQRPYMFYTRDPNGPFGARSRELERSFCDGEMPFT